MHCVHPTCNSKSGTLPKDIAFHSIPTKPSIRAIWLKLLNTEPSELGDDGAVCSKHFLKADLYYDKTGEYRIRAGALPIVKLQNLPDSSIVKICRICFATDRKLYKTTEYNNLDRAYNIVTGLSLENEMNLPPYLCLKCSLQLLNSVHFRTQSLRAHLILLEVVKKYKKVTLQSIKAVIGSEGQLGSHLKTKEANNCDLIINHDEEINPQEDVDLIDNIDVKMEQNDIIDSENTAKDCDFFELNQHDTKIDIDDSVNQDDYEDNGIRFSPLNSDMVFKDLQEEKDEDSTDIPIENKEVDDSTNTHTVVKSDNSEEDPLLTTKKLGIKQINKTKKIPSQSSLLADKLIIKPGSARARATRGDIGPGTIVKLQRRNDKKTHKKPLDKNLYLTVDDVLSWSKLRGISKPYRCQYCDFQTILKSDLTSHTKVCDVQNKRKGSNVSKSHTKPYRCKICKDQFKYSYELKFHTPLHTGKGSYKCKKCHESFNFENSLNIHTQKFHPDVSKESEKEDGFFKGKS